MLRPCNIRVNAISPRDILTARWMATRSYGRNKMVEGRTLDRYGRATEFARVVEFFTSEASSYITGQVIRDDRGAQGWPA